MCTTTLRRSGKPYRLTPSEIDWVDDAYIWRDDNRLDS